MGHIKQKYLCDEQKAGRVFLRSVEEEAHGALLGVNDVVEGILPLAVHQAQEVLTRHRRYGAWRRRG